MKRLRLTPAALARIEQIFFWTIDAFGVQQAEAYEAALFAGIEALAAGVQRGRSCEALLPSNKPVSGLLYVRINRHFVIFREVAGEIEILDLIHSARNLPAVIELLGGDTDQ